MFAAIYISSTIIIFNSDKVNLNCVLFWSDIGSTKSPDSLGIDMAVCIVVLLMLTAATQVEAVETTVGLFGIIVYIKVKHQCRQ